MADKSYHELIDEEWKIVEKTLPPEKKVGRPQTDARAAFNGILWIQNVENFLPLIRLFAKCIGTAWELVFQVINFLLSGGNVNDNLQPESAIISKSKGDLSLHSR